MTRPLTSLLAAMVLACGTALWAEDTPAAPAAPAPAAAAAAAPAPAAAPAAAAPAAAAAAAPATPPKSTEDRLTALEKALNQTIAPSNGSDKITTADKAEAAWQTTNEFSLNTGDNCWLLVSSALVLLMTLPGLALFYGGLVGRKNVLGTMMQSLTIACLVSILWAFVGYSFAFGPGAVDTTTTKDDKGVETTTTTPNWTASFWGGTKYFCLDKVVTDSAHQPATVSKDPKTGAETLNTPANNAPLVPGPYSGYCASVNHGSYCLFQLMFAIITPALICGAYAERMKFSAMCIFSALWLIIVYCPLAHMVWGENGYFNPYFTFVKSPAFDFAGGTVVHISSGVAALMTALFLGKRQGYPDKPTPPHNLTLSFIGASLLWVGWFGFNAGSALQANGLAVIAFANTHFATAAAALTWPLTEWIVRGKPTVLGAMSGAVAGLVAVTPASGYVTPMGAITLGAIVGPLCFTTSSYLKKALGYDDTLDAFGVHAIGGMWGAMATGIFFAIDANPAVAGANAPGASGAGNLYQYIVGHDYNVVLGQAKAVGIAIAMSAVGSALILTVLKYTIGLRVKPEDEEIGLDLSQHGEEGYHGLTA